MLCPYEMDEMQPSVAACVMPVIATTMSGIISAGASLTVIGFSNKKRLNSGIISEVTAERVRWGRNAVGSMCAASESIECSQHARG